MQNECKKIAVIMAGGSGERFWPLSRQNHPKQLLALGHTNQTMLQEAVDRVRHVIANEDIYVQTMPHLLDAIRNAELGIPVENIIAEPCKRNTAGCLSYAAAHMLAKYDSSGDDLVLSILTADHVIGDTGHFLRTVEQALDTATFGSALVTIGVPPTYPSTGFGYIQTGLPDETGSVDKDRPEVYSVKAFKEKPELSVAESYLEAGNYYWNSGMFFWRLDTFVNEFNTADKPFADAIYSMKLAMQVGDHEKVEAVFNSLQSISIDYALMEKAKNVAMVRATFPWDDVGSWSALDRTRQPDGLGNVAVGDSVVIDTNNSIIYNNTQNMTVGVVGMENVVLVVTDDAILLVSKDRTEDVKQIVESLKKRNAPQV